MAKVKLPALSERASGPIGKNLLYKRSGGLNIITARPASCNTIPSKRQRIVRRIITKLNALQATLTPEQKDTWFTMESYRATSTFGITNEKSPFNSFAQVNFFRLHRGLACLMDAPTTPMKGNISDPEVQNKAGDPGTVTITWTLPSQALQQDAVNIWMSRPFPTATRKPFPPDFRHYTYVAGNTTSANISGLEIGKHYYFQLRFVLEDGRVNAFLRTSVLRIV